MVKDIPQTENLDKNYEAKDTIEKEQAMQPSGPFASLRFRNFRFLWTGTLLSNAAQWIQQVTLNWLVYDLTGSGAILGTINLVRSVASLSMIPAAGVLIDRINRKKLMMATASWLLIISAGLGLVLLSGRGRIAYLFIFSVLGGMVQSIDQPLRQVMIFSLVPRAFTPNAMALIQTGWSIMRSFGPSLGGFLILWFGPGGNFLIQSFAYALIILNILFIQFSPQVTTGQRNSVFQNIREGIKYVKSNRQTQTFMLVGFILPLFIIPIFSVLPPIYAQDVFKGGPDTLGFLLSAIGVGGIMGGIVIASLGKMERRGLLQLSALFLLSLSLIGFALCTRFWVALIMMALAGFFEIIFLTTNQTLLQLSIPNEVRGRVTSIINLNAALAPLGGLVAGFGSDLMGSPKGITIVLASIGVLFSIGIFLGSSTVRNYRLSQTISVPHEETTTPTDKIYS